ncbi:MAG: FliA/WhiG family RNA polymerase sigma factor [Candidatus Cloacimonetes bacterium]|nr:FliA/WhiG family RNA polymerase sigma factor [Candidatus Cloacimonadota bacterium]
MQDDELKLWELYKKTGRSELLEKIVEKYLNLVHYHANRLYVFTSNVLERDDLYSAGIIGLMEAIERFDYTRGFEFQTYASNRVRGAIIDEIRRVDWVPRSIRHKSKSIDAAINAFFTHNGELPTDEEIAEEMEISLDDYYNITDKLGPLFLASLDNQLNSDNDGEHIHLSETIEDTSAKNIEEERIVELIKKRIIEAISSLPEKEKLVISLYYYEELNLKEIAAVLNVTESRVSQIHSSAITKLRVALKNII